MYLFKLYASRTSGDFPVRRVCVSKRMKFSGSLACVDFRCAAAEATSTAAVNLESEREKCSLRAEYGGCACTDEIERMPLCTELNFYFTDRDNCPSSFR
uniref:Uncharacterized protein n=1 Tax=Trichogramma kaykai TaxID=54128 RepID=A0ABD2W2Q6_9HYME